MDGDYIIKWDSILLDNNLQYEEDSIEVLDRDVWRSWSKDIRSMKVKWKDHSVEESTWETERDTWYK